MTNQISAFKSLPGYKPLGGGKYQARCPSHDDKNPSLSILYADTKILLTCHAGCPTEAIVAAMGLTMADLFLNNNGHNSGSGQRKEVAVYKYQDFEVVRYEPKQFLQRRSDGNGGYIWNLDGVTRMLYHNNELPEAIAQGTTIYSAEGEKDTDRLRSLGLVATCNAGGAGKWEPQYTAALKGADVVIIPDADQPGRDHAQMVARACHGTAARVRILTLPGPGKDVSDWLDNGGTADQLRELAEVCPTWEPVEKAGLPLAISGAELLDRVADFYQQYVVMTRHQANTMSLFTCHTYNFEAADATPYINVNSPEKQSGKTRLLEVAELVVNKPWLTGRVTPAVLARKVDKEEPTLLLDESDAAFKSDKEYAEALRGILNTGHRRGGKTSICVGQGAKIDYKDLSTFCPKVIAGIGKLPDTVSDRSIAIILKRKTASECVERFRRKKAEIPAQVLKDNLVTLASSLTLTGVDPELPSELDDRAADGWEPLLAIADAIGGDWTQKARVAAIALSCGGVKEDQSDGSRLLADIKAIFTVKQADRLPSAEIVQELIAMEEAPWADIDRRPLTANKLARLLKPYGVTPATMRIGLSTPKGYHKADFTDAWKRYTSSLTGILTATNTTSATNHVQNKTATIPGNNKTVSDEKHEQLSYDVPDVADVKPDRGSRTVNDDVDLPDPPHDPADDLPPADPAPDNREPWETQAGVWIDKDGNPNIGAGDN